MSHQVLRLPERNPISDAPRALLKGIDVDCARNCKRNEEVARSNISIPQGLGQHLFSVVIFLLRKSHNFETWLIKRAGIGKVISSLACKVRQAARRRRQGKTPEKSGNPENTGQNRGAFTDAEECIINRPEDFHALRGKSVKCNDITKYSRFCNWIHGETLLLKRKKFACSEN